MTRTDDELKIKLVSLKEGENPLHLEGKGTELDLPGEVVLTSPLRIDGSLVKLNTQLILKTEIRVSLEAECSRCLKSFQQSLQIPLERYYQIGGEAEVPGEENELISISESQQDIDLKDTIREVIMLGIPIKPLCREECGGLCPECGADLNAGTCTCKTRQTDSRWAALEALRE
jgi:uncharacterized protein